MVAKTTLQVVKKAASQVEGKAIYGEKNRIASGKKNRIIDKQKPHEGKSRLYYRWLESRLAGRRKHYIINRREVVAKTSL